MAEDLDNDFEQEDFEQHDFEEDFEQEEIVEDFGEVLSLTEYNDSNSGGGSVSNYVVAEYDNIDIVETTKLHRAKAKDIVSKITKFIIEFNDIELSEDHKKYIKAVSNLQFEQLNDMLFMVAANRQMLDNMIRRINSVQGEDFSMIMTYNTILNQQIKLHKELSLTYKNIPAVIRKMRLDVLENPEEMSQQDTGTDTISENFGTQHFNDTKHLLKEMRDRKNRKNNTIN